LPHPEQQPGRLGKFWLTSDPVRIDDGGVKLLLGIGVARRRISGSRMKGWRSLSPAWDAFASSKLAFLSTEPTNGFMQDVRLLVHLFECLAVSQITARSTCTR